MFSAGFSWYELYGHVSVGLVSWDKVSGFLRRVGLSSSGFLLVAGCGGLWFLSHGLLSIFPGFSCVLVSRFWPYCSVLCDSMLGSGLGCAVVFLPVLGYRLVLWMHCLTPFGLVSYVILVRGVYRLQARI